MCDCAGSDFLAPDTSSMHRISRCKQSVSGLCVRKNCTKTCNFCFLAMQFLNRFRQKKSLGRITPHIISSDRVMGVCL